MRVLQLGKFYVPFVGGMELLLRKSARASRTRSSSRWWLRTLAAAPNMITERFRSHVLPAWGGCSPARWRHLIRFGYEGSMPI
jgi:hypothetical protein